MKTSSIAFVFVFLSFHLLADSTVDDDKYVNMMKKEIEALYASRTSHEYQQSVNAFERVATIKNNEWEPLYYSAFANVMLANLESDNIKKDVYLDNAMNAINKAKAIANAESEIMALEGFIVMMRVSVDPSSRGPQLAGSAMQLYNKALATNPNNPRALALLAQMQYGTAQFFGSSTVEACDTINKALEKFATFKSDNPLAPQWGLKMAEGLKANCK